MNARLMLLLLGVSMASLVAANKGISYTILSRVYLPYSYDPETFAFGEDASEQVAYDSQRKFIYSIGKKY